MVTTDLITRRAQRSHLFCQCCQQFAVWPGGSNVEQPRLSGSDSDVLSAAKDEEETARSWPNGPWYLKAFTKPEELQIRDEAPHFRPTPKHFVFQTAHIFQPPGPLPPEENQAGGQQMWLDCSVSERMCFTRQECGQLCLHAAEPSVVRGLIHDASCLFLQFVSSRMQ